MTNADNLVNLAAAFIFKTFVVSITEANEIAQEYVGLIDAKGGDTNTFRIEQLQLLIVRGLDSTYEWRDERERIKAIQKQQETINSYNDYLNAKRTSPFKKW